MPQDVLTAALVAAVGCGIGIVVVLPAVLIAGMRGRPKMAIRGATTLLSLVLVAVVATALLGSSFGFYLDLTQR